MTAIKKKDLDFIAFAADEHMRLVQNGYSCLWGDASPQHERVRVTEVLDSLAGKCSDNGKTQPSRAPLTMDDFWFLEFVLAERRDFLLEGIGQPWSGSAESDTRMMERILERLRQAVGLSARDYDLGPDKAYIGSGQYCAGLIARPGDASTAGYLDICGNERHLSFAERGEVDPPMVFLTLDNASSGKRGSALKQTMLAAIAQSYETQNGENEDPAWRREELALATRLLSHGELLVNPLYLDYDRMDDDARKAFRRALSVNRVLQAWDALLSGLKEDPDLPDWLHNVLE